ncbi:cysteine-rich CWC family protein [Thalassolituus sp. LLYu03]|uniref:cysteine-rich CWC family protein n=1 Tax=Thalassolituus sp. LLYu03 TaxID=3421656 RepID=UPI003D281571
MPSDVQTVNPKDPALIAEADRAALRCPLCGEDNQCAVAAGDEATSCWCFAPGLTTPAALLAQIPPEARNRQCVCAACVARAMAGGSVADGAAKHER